MLVQRVQEFPIIVYAGRMLDFFGFPTVDGQPDILSPS